MQKNPPSLLWTIQSWQPPVTPDPGSRSSWVQGQYLGRAAHRDSCEMGRALVCTVIIIWFIMYDYICVSTQYKTFLKIVAVLVSYSTKKRSLKTVNDLYKSSVEFPSQADWMAPFGTFSHPHWGEAPVKPTSAWSSLDKPHQTAVSAVWGRRKTLEKCVAR